MNNLHIAKSDKKCKSKSQLRYHLTNVRMTITKKQKMASVGKDVEKLEALCTADENGKWCGYYENSLAVPQKVNTEQLYDPAIPFLGIYTREMNMCPHKSS